MKLHRIKAGHYTVMINGVFYSIIHTIHWDIYYGGELGIYICSSHTLTDARAMLEGIVEGGLSINKDIWSPMRYYLAGWRSDDGAELMETFGMTYDQASKICDELKIIEGIAKSNKEDTIE